MTTHDHYDDVTEHPRTASPRQGDEVLDPSIAQGDWTAESQESREPMPVEPTRAEPVEPARAEPTPDTAAPAGLIADDELSGLRARWDHVQASFVDDPRQCVQKADGLVTDVVDHLTTSFARARSGLEEQWARGEEASTEDLRVALTRYRDFFERLLAV